jgi:nitrate/TMAO reductase-like tetraheme cytochrome c subunit
LKQIFFVVLCVLAAFNACAQDETDVFLKRHWAFPIPSQGKAPESYTQMESSLDPDACGSCHAKQYQDWRTSLHSHAMGPGVMGQLLEIKSNAVGELRDCTRCHAPLSEQEVSLRKQLRGVKQIAALHEQGLVCAACHVRRHVRFGPPQTKPPAEGQSPHDGFVSTTAFEDGRFCATCHQFGADGYVLNGKPLENTYAEWQSSQYAKQGQQCQSCHMPERQHLWRGIHDAEITRKGITINPTAPTYRDGELSAQLTIINSGTGHDFPTYVTPRVVVQIFQESADNKLIAGTLREKIIARQVSMDLSAELADTRLAPSEQMLLDYLAPFHPNATAIVMRVRIEPDYFYTGLYRSLLGGHPKGKSANLISTALKNSLESAYDLYVQRFNVQSEIFGMAQDVRR